MKNQVIYTTIALLALAGKAQANNPLVPNVGMADPHGHVFQNKVYLYTTHDQTPGSPVFDMRDWKVWSSNDLVNWNLERTISPTDTYIGPSTSCWAPDAATKNGKYYFYFSNKNLDTGVMVANAPGGPFTDALGGPLLPGNLTTTKEYDISVPVDDNGSAYIIFGVNDYDRKSYHIAKLGNNMISLAETPKPITITGGMHGSDKPNVHIHNGKYYLSAGSNYAVANNIYGPYSTRRNEGNDSHPYGLNDRAHGNFFDWKNQSFFVWCRFVVSVRQKYRDSHMTYVHYKANGDMVYDEELLRDHYATGVGQYSASWSKIQAEWYMEAGLVQKEELATGGFGIGFIQNNGYLVFPNVKNVAANTSMTFNVSSKTGGKIEVRENGANGPLLGSCTVPNTGSWDTYQNVNCNLTNTAGTKKIYLKFVGTSTYLLNLDWFRFN